MAKRRRRCYSGIGGQAVLEGIMMKNQEKYAIAVRKADGEITLELENYQGLLHGSKIKEIPFIRGIFNFIDSMILGMKCLNFSAAVCDEKEEETARKAEGASGGGKLVNTLVTVVSVALAVGLFMVMPYYIASRFRGFVRNDSLMAIIEGVIRMAIFLLYVWGITLMKDIRRLYRYHGAEHKCINCIEKGRPLTVHNVMRSSRIHRRCGTSFIFFVLIVSIILFTFIRVENPALRVVLRILLMPVVAGISYEIIRLAGRSNNFFILLLSLPGMWVQRLTTKEPDREMAEVAIAAVEAVFDWRTFLYDNFGYEVDETWMEDEDNPGEEEEADEVEQNPEKEAPKGQEQAGQTSEDQNPGGEDGSEADGV